LGRFLLAHVKTAIYFSVAFRKEHVNPYPFKNPINLIYEKFYTGSFFIACRILRANIVLKNFQAVQTTAGAKIIWEFTAEEKDVTCHLEKSTDGINFTTLRTIIIESTRQQALHSYTDKDATGQVFYRLRITKDSYTPYISPIVSFTRSRSETSDPQHVSTGQGLFSGLLLQTQMLRVQLVDLRGQAKIRQFIKATDVERIFRSSYSSLPKGYYVLRITDMDNNTVMNKCLYKF
jgi:hypothetical protein